MAKIPTYNAQVNLTTDVGASKVSGFTETAGAMGKGMQQLGGVLFEVGAKIQKVRVEEESERAMIEAHKRINQIEWDASVDTQVGEFDDKYRLRLKQVRDEIGNGIKDGQARKLFFDKYDFQSVNTELKIKQYGYKNLIESRLVTLGQREGQLMQAWFAEKDPIRKQEIGFEMSQLYQQAAVDNTMSRMDAQKQIDRINRYLPEGQAKWDIQNDISTQEEDSDVLAALRDPKRTPQLNQETRLKLIGESQARIFQNNQKFKKQVTEKQEAGFQDIIDKTAKDQLTLNDIEQALLVPEEVGGVKHSVLVRMREGMRKRTYADLNNMIKEKTPRKNPTQRAKEVKKYMDLIDRTLDDATDKWAAREMLAEAWADGTIDQGEMKVLNGVRTGMKDIAWNNNTGKIVSMIKAIKSWRGEFNASDEDIVSNIKRLLGTEISQEKLNEIRKAYIQAKIPTASNLPAEGGLYMDASGAIRRVTQDLDIKDK